jgi:phospholipid/cholesterol/gamma-HCH transport system substrate-binding protein
MKIKNEALVGMVVLAGIVVALVGSIWLSGMSIGKPQRELTAVFSEVGVLAEGSSVKYRGVKVGKVTHIELAPRGDGVLVTMNVDDRVILPRDVGVLVEPESFFGDWQAAIVSRAQWNTLDFVQMPGVGAIPGATMPDITQLTAVAADIAGNLKDLSNRIGLAFTEQTALDIRRTVGNVEDISSQLKGFMDQQTRLYGQVGQNVLDATANIRTATNEATLTARGLRSQFTTGDVQQILGNARQASANLAAFSAQLNAAAAGMPGLVARTDTTVRTFGQTASTLNSTIQGMQPGLAQVGPTFAEARQAMATLNQAIQKINEGNGSLGRLIADPALYEETQRAIVTLQRLLADIQQNPGKYIGQLQVF